MNPVKLNISLDRDRPIPIYTQIKDQVRGLIQAGQIKTGDQLPTIRDLSAMLAVNVNTVVLAYRDLSKEGLITTARGKGTFVSGTLSGEELQRMRGEKLRGMLEALLRETDRFGYTRDEVGRALVELFRRPS